MSNDLFKRTGAGDFSKFLKVLISGPPKSGKTTLLGTVPNILVLDTEPHANNLESIAHKDVPYVTINSTEDLRQVLMVLGNTHLRQQLAQNTYNMPDIGAVAIDTLDTLQKLMKAERLKEERKSQFLRDDWGWLKTEMEKIIESFTALPMHVFFVVHTKTQEVGKGDDTYTTVLPGLEGAIAQSIAGMVGYSLLSFRKEEIDATGAPVTNYYLRTEGDSAHDFLGTRTAGRLPTIIKPDMKTIYDTVMANRPAQAPPVAQPAAPPAAAQTTPPAAPPQQTEEKPEEVAQTASQPEQVQTDVQTAPAAPETPTEAPQPQQQTAPPAEKPDNNEPVTPAAMGHVKRVYDALEIAFPEDLVATKTMGEARNMVSMWRAVLQDHQEGKGAAGKTPQAEMLDFMGGSGWLPAEGAQAPEQPKQVTPKVDGNIDEVLAYVSEGGDGVDLDRVQEAYDYEIKKGDNARKSLISKLESFGAKPPSQPEPEVQTGGETPSEPVTPQEAVADSPPTEEEAVKAVEEGLGGEVVAVQEGIPEGTPCDVCKNPIDDLDLAELGMKRFNKVLCVQDYLAELKK